MDIFDTTVYDNARYHEATVRKYDLPKQQASIHTAFYLGWLIDNNLCSEGFKEDSEEMLADCQNQFKTPIDIYKCWNRCLTDDMLSFEGNQFTMAYFDFSKGLYLQDYAEVLQKDLPSEFHVEYNSSNQQLISKRISERFQAWQDKKRQKKFWQFWK